MGQGRAGGAGGHAAGSVGNGVVGEESGREREQAGEFKKEKAMKARANKNSNSSITRGLKPEKHKLKMCSYNT